MIEALLWDNDGLLVDTESLFFEANREALQEAGILLTYERFADISLRQGKSLIDLAYEKGWSRDKVSALRRKRDQIYLDRIQKGVRIMPAIQDALEDLRGRFRMGIVTNSQRVHLEAAHAHTDLLSHFEFTVVHGDYLHSKPHPAPYIEGLKRLGLPADCCLAIEDSERGFQSAIRAGLKCIVIPGGRPASGEFHGATALLDSARDLPHLIQG